MNTKRRRFRLLAVLLILGMVFASVLYVQAAEGDPEVLTVLFDGVDITTFEGTPDVLYDGEPHSVTVEQDGAPFTAATLTIAYTDNLQGSGSSEPPVDAGTYWAMVTLTQAPIDQDQPAASFRYTLPNYTGTMSETIYQTYAFTISQRQLTLSVADDQELTYSGEEEVPVWTLTGHGMEEEAARALIDVEYAEDTMDAYTPVPSPTDVGAYTASYRLSDTAGGNYTINDVPSISFQIAEKPISITVEDQEVLYDPLKQQDYRLVLPELSAALGFYNEDLSEVWLETVYMERGTNDPLNDGTPQEAGIYTVEIRLEGDRSNQYDMSLVQATLKVALGDGAVYLTQGKPYALSSENAWTVEEDPSVTKYGAGAEFYVPADGTYTFRAVN